MKNELSISQDALDKLKQANEREIIKINLENL